MMTYQHTQKGRLHLVLLPTAVAMIALGFWLRHAAAPAPAAIGVWAAALLILLLLLCFRTLTVRAEGEGLALRYGTIPLFFRRLPFAAITSVEPGRTSFIDGWGIHYIPGRGWTYNLWGFACVVVHLGPKTVRIGTDDPEGLLAFLKAKLPSAPAPAPD
jgi:hypothetical protein